MICVEMALASMLHCVAFPSSEYNDIPAAYGDGEDLSQGEGEGDDEGEGEGERGMRGMSGTSGTRGMRGLYPNSEPFPNPNTCPNSNR